MPADNTPTLSEIEGRGVDPELGSGEPAVVYDNSQLLNIINQNAQFKARNDWNKYQQFLGDYQDRLKTMQDISDLPVADSDREFLKKKGVEIFKNALKDPYQIYSPDFNSNLAKLKSDAVSSKLARDYGEKNLQWMALHPEMSTEENKEMTLDYLDNQTLEKGGRKTFALQMPDVFDYMGYVGNLKDDPSVKETIDASFVSPDNQFYTERQDTKYKRDPFLKLVDYSYDANPKIRKYADRQYKELPDNVKAQFKDPKAYWNALGSKAFGSDKDILNQGKPNMQSNSNYLKKQELGLKWANYGLDKRKLDKADAGDMIAADGILRELSDSLNNGKTITEVDDKGKSQEFIEISDPTLIKNFATIDKDGKTTNTADAIRYDPKKDQAYLVYFDKKGNGDVKYNKTGGAFIEKKVPVEGRTWANLVTQRTYGAKDKGNVNELVQDVITKAKGLYNLSQRYNGKKEEQAKPKENGVVGDKLLFNGTEYTLDEVKAAGYKDFNDFLKENK